MSAANPKYKVGDVLQIANDTSEYFTVIGFQTVSGELQYIMESSGGGTMALGVDFVDSNPDWHLKKTTPWAWIAVGAGVMLAALFVASSKK